MSKNKPVKKKFLNMPIIIVLLVLIILIGFLVIATLTEEKFSPSKYTEIKFGDMYQTKDSTKTVSEKYKMLSGKKVVLRGYMAEQSPVDESFIYLVSQPFVVCPFCTLGDVTKLDVMYVEMENGAGIKFRNEPIDVYGTLEVEEKQDMFEYTTQFRIIADSIVNVEETEGDPQVEAYFAQLNQDDLIFYITTTQTNMGWFLDLDYLYNELGYTDDMIISEMGAKENYDGLSKEVEQCGENITKLKKIVPSDPRLAELNLELIDIYEKQKALFEDLCSQVAIIGDANKTKEEKLPVLDKFREIYKSNIELFNRSNDWNNKLRE
jgi:hypothetical protein